jgi:hypothetical protein
LDPALPRPPELQIGDIEEAEGPRQSCR